MEWRRGEWCGVEGRLEQRGGTGREWGGVERSMGWSGVHWVESSGVGSGVKRRGEEGRGEERRGEERREREERRGEDRIG